MTPRYLRVSVYALALVTIPITLLLARWSQTWNVPFSAFYTPGQRPGTDAAFIGSVLPAVLGMLGMTCGLLGLLVSHRQHFPLSRTTSFALLCIGYMATGLLLGVIFLADGWNPIDWTWNAAVVYPVILTVEFAAGLYLVREHMNDPHGFGAHIRAMSKRHRFASW